METIPFYGTIQNKLRENGGKNSMRVLSGIQPSGTLHLGNYFGMMLRMIKYQNENELF